MKFVRINGTDFESSLDDGEFPETLMVEVEAALALMKNNPGDTNEEITLVLVNDFEEEESEDDESEDEKSELDKSKEG